MAKNVMVTTPPSGHSTIKKEGFGWGVTAGPLAGRGAVADLGGPFAPSTSKPTTSKPTPTPKPAPTQTAAPPPKTKKPHPPYPQKPPPTSKGKGTQKDVPGEGRKKWPQ